MTGDSELSEPTPFLLIGGAPAVDRLVEEFYLRMDTLPAARAIRALHLDDLTSTKAVLKLYLGEWLGGPPLYSKERGHPRLRMRHMHFSIGPAERDAWMLCMRGALETVVTQEPLRKTIEERLFQLADWVRNDAGNPHDAKRKNAPSSP
jgi:hemoglobin